MVEITRDANIRAGDKGYAHDSNDLARKTIKEISSEN